MSKKRVTSRMVAERAGVSRTTVSFVLNNVAHANITTATRNRVLSAARDLGYVPDVAAQALVSGRSNNIGLITVAASDQVFLDPHIPNIMTGLFEIARARGFRLLVEHIDHPDDTETVINLLRSKSIAGAVINWINAEKLLAALSPREEYPIVIINGAPLDGLYTVSADQTGGVRQALDHLYERGQRRIACIAYSTPDDSPTVRERLAIYRAFLAQHHLPFCDGYIQYGEYSVESGRLAMQALLNVEPRPTAVFTFNDTMGFGALHAVRNAGLRVPDDVAIVGFDDNRLSRWMLPALSSVHVPEIAQGYLAGEQLMRLIHGETPAERHIRLETQLIVRESSAKPRECSPPVAEF
ncbi:MAG: LacI family transcriptional regulator [Chloroflexi bacterium]|nr:LacI family transcriptional regulator [Chloroflexota bacterium]